MTSSLRSLGERLEAIENLLKPPTPKPAPPKPAPKPAPPKPAPKPPPKPAPKPPKPAPKPTPGGERPPFDPEAGHWGLWPRAADKAWLRQGSRGDAVSYLQGVIFRKAGGAIAIDGIFGAATKRRVVDVQRFFKVNADGVVGDETWGVIDFLAGS